MDYLRLFNDNTSKIQKNSQKIRKFLDCIVDKSSFVETDVFMSGKNYIDGSDALGEGVITGYATINENPVCVIAQNSEVLGGSFSKAQAEKILKCIKRSINTFTPLISIIDSNGARVGEGISMLEGYAEIIAAATELKNHTTHIAIIKGNAIGLMGMYAASADFVYFMEDATFSALPPLVLATSSTDNTKNILGKTNFSKNSLASTFSVKSNSDLKNSIVTLFNYIYEDYIESNDDPNRTYDLLDSSINKENLLKALADEKKYVELFSEYTDEICTAFTSINSLPVGIVTTNSERLSKKAIKKLQKFVDLLESYNMPLVSLVDSKGLKTNLEEEQEGRIFECTELISTISQTSIPKIAVICDNAIGYSYVTLASKSVGYDYVLAFSNAKIAPLSSEVAVSVLYNNEITSKNPIKNREELAEKYKNEEMNPFVSAKDGFIDNIIEPALLRPYVSSALAMLTK